MIKRLFSALLLVGAPLFADSMFVLGAGYRQDDLKWSIAGPGDVPDVMSELSWKDLQMAEVSFSAMGNLWLIGSYRASADYAWILHGKNRDSDYAGSGRTYEYSRSENCASRGEAFDFKVGIGRTFCFFGDCLKITPLAGYAQMEQHLRMYHGNQKIDLIGFRTGRFHGLHSGYNTRWESPWVGVDLLYLPSEDFTLYASFEAHAPYYKAKGHWNLRTDFAGDFIHRANGRGYWYTLAGSYVLCSGLEAGIMGEAAIFETDHGTDTTRFRVDGIEGVLEGRTRLNSVHWHSYRLQLFLSYVL